LILALSSCSGTRPLTEKQYLYTGAEIVYIDKENIVDFPSVNKEIQKVLKPKPNSKFIGTRARLSLYNIIREPKNEKGFMHWLKNDLGQEPVLYDKDLPGRTKRIIDNRLKNNGYFHASTESEEIFRKKEVALKYYVKCQKPITIGSIDYTESESGIRKAIGDLKATSKIRSGDVYNLSILMEERRRIESELKDIGYYYFDKDFLIYRADSLQGSNVLKLGLELKEEIPETSLMSYKINRIYIHDGFSQREYNPDTTHLGKVSFMSINNDLRPKVVDDVIATRPGTFYSRNRHLASNSSLVGLGMFRYANTRYDLSDSVPQHLDLKIFLTRRLKQSLSAEMSMVSKTNSFVGPGLRVTYRIRNVLGGSETLSLNLNGRFETQYSGEYKGNTAYELSLNVNLDVPRIIPNIGFRHSIRFIPVTRFTFGAGTYRRQGIYRLNTFNVGYQYNWRKNSYASHELKPVELSITNMVDVSDEFLEFLTQNPSLRRSFEEQFITGLSYTYTLNNLNRLNRTPVYFSGGIDLSGNIISAIKGIGNSDRPNPGNPYTLFGQPYSQYVRLRSDLRYYLEVGENSTLVSRLYMGAGIPYYNSSVMPYVKQFFIGGTNSVRSFIARSVGPGTYQPPDSLQGIYIEQVGDIKGEANLEYRFPILGYLKGAAFIDAGNIWLMNEYDDRPGGKFDIRSFYKELAIGSGLGLRIDANVVVVRLDIAFPLRKPWLPEGERWVFDEIDFRNNFWRKKNLIWNFSIGYPF